MIKKIILACMLTSMFASWGYAVYRYFTPEVAPIIYQSSMYQSSLQETSQSKNLKVTQLMASNPSEEADTEIKAEEEETRKVIYYCSQDNQDCEYLDSQIFSHIELELGVELSNFIQIIDVNELEVQSASKRKEMYGFANYPAFVILEKNEAGEYIKTDCFQYDSAAPWTIEQVKAWLADRDIVSFE